MDDANRAVWRWCALAGLVLAATTAAGDVKKDKDDEEDLSADPLGALEYSFAPAQPMAAMDCMGATPGGAQDIGYARDRVRAGEIPHPNTFTPEGLFSEHDLPLASSGRCRELLCVGGEAVPARLLAQPEVRYLAQLGFESGLSAASFRRPPLNLVAVVDTSGSMSGTPLETVRQSLEQVARQLGEGDQLAIVRYSDAVVEVLPPTPAGRRVSIRRAIASLASSGSTFMEAGLELGFRIARLSAARFDGTTRVMLFTDERPNVGRVDAGSFMAMARDASERGIGMTTIGVSTHFGAELATAVSSVRGGNLFFFPDTAEMRRVFTEELDTMVTELAHELVLEVRPARGLRLAGVYGIPGEALEWTGDGGIRLEIETVFVSRRKGAIFLAFAPDVAHGLPSSRLSAGDRLGRLSLAYREVSGARKRDALWLELERPDRASPGLRRGSLLVDEVTALKRATELHHERNDQEGAYQLVHALAGRFRSHRDAALEAERTLVFALERTLARASGHAGEPTLSRAVDPVSGLPGMRSSP
jgi:Ca-activated chloride channel family protein